MPVFIAITVMSFIVFTGISFKKIRGTRKIAISKRLRIDEERAELFETEARMSGKNMAWLEKKQMELTQSNTGVTLFTYLIILTLSIITIFTFVFSVLQNATFAVVVSALGFLIPEYVVRGLIKKNITFFNTQLLKALRRMASNLRSGGSVKQAITDVTRARSIPVIVRMEFRKVLSDIEYGATVEKALFNLAERTGSRDAYSLAVAVEIQRQLGGNLAQIMDSVAQGISNRAIMESDILATLSQAKASAKLLTLMPVGTVILILIFNRAYFNPMFDNLLGRIIFIICMSLIIIGFFVFQKMTTLDDS